MMEKHNQSVQLRLTNHIGELKKIQETLESVSPAMQLPPGVVMPLNLVMEEAFSNIVNYAFTDDLKHFIDIEISRNGDELVIHITDDGQPYDPTKKADPDIGLSAEERRIGGLGIFLIKKIMDKVEYEYTDNKNHLLLTKRISQ